MTGRTIPVTRTDGSEVASEATLENIKAKTDNLDIALSVLRDALRGTSNKTNTDIVTALGQVVLAAGTATIGKVDQGAAGASPWAQNLTQIGGAALSLGQKTAANSLSVAGASDGYFVVGGATPDGSAPAAGTYSVRVGGQDSNGNKRTLQVDSNGFAYTADQQARAWRDDGTESGIIRTEQKRGALVQMPFIYGTYTAVTGGAATATLTGPLASDINQDGSGTYLRVTVQASASLANYVYVKFWIFGNVFGLRMQRSASTPVGCMIDGVAYTVPTVGNVEPSSGSTSSVYGNVDGVLIADDLGPGRHFVELAFPAFLSGSNRVYVVGGYLVDSAAGYQRLSGQVVSTSNGTLALTATTGATAQYPSQPAGIRGWRKALFYNTAGSPITVYMVYSLATSTIIWSKSVPANDSIELDPQGIIVDVTNTRFYVSGSGVNATFIWAV